MVVVGKHAAILADAGNNMDVSPLTPNYQDLDKVSIVDMSFQYMCQYMAKVYKLVFRNDISVPSMDNKLIPQFIMRESGLVVKYTAKLQAVDKSVEDCSICFPNFDIRITLFMHGVFS